MAGNGATESWERRSVASACITTACRAVLPFPSKDVTSTRRTSRKGLLRGSFTFSGRAPSVRVKSAWQPQAGSLKTMGWVRPPEPAVLGTAITECCCQVSPSALYETRIALEPATACSAFGAQPSARQRLLGGASSSTQMNGVALSLRS